MWSIFLRNLSIWFSRIILAFCSSIFVIQLYFLLVTIFKMNLISKYSLVFKFLIKKFIDIILVWIFFSHHFIKPIKKGNDCLLSILEFRCLSFFRFQSDQCLMIKLSINNEGASFQLFSNFKQHTINYPCRTSFNSLSEQELFHVCMWPFLDKHMFHLN